MTGPFLWFAAVKHLKRIKQLTGLAPKRRFVSAQAIEAEIWKITQPQKALRELDSMIIRTVLIRFP
jgi:hypothetical protein